MVYPQGTGVWTVVMQGLGPSGGSPEPGGNIEVTAWGSAAAQCSTDTAQGFPPNELDV